MSMRLSTRLLLLTLGCLLPVIGAQIWTQISLHAQRQHQLADVAARQVQGANGDLLSIVAGVRQVARVVAQFPEIGTPGPACRRRLAEVRQATQSVRVLVVMDAAGHVRCASTPPLDAIEPVPAWLAEQHTATDDRVGRLTTVPGIDEPFLPIAARIDGVGGGMTIVAGLDLQWLAHHIEEIHVDHGIAATASTLIVADRDGTVVARYPGGAQWIGRKLPEPLLRLISGTTPTVTTLADPEGGQRIAAYIPASIEPMGLVAITTLSMTSLSADLERASNQNLILTGLSVIAATVLAWLAGRRFIYRPTEALLRATRRWQEGDLTVRAALNEDGSEFAALSESFNAMASTLQARDLERRLQAQFLEAQVAERTRALSETNNRLQVEIAEREKTEAALLQAQKLQAVGQLAGGIAHDFNNMLATVLGNLELMERRVAQSERGWTTADAERLRGLIERATGAVQRGAQLTSQLLAFSRRQRLSARPTDLNKLVSELIILATSTLGRRVRVESDLAPDLWPALIDPSQMEAAILNLCLNARDAMPEGGQLCIRTANVVVNPSIDSGGVTPGAYVMVSISDTGHGMTPDVQRRAFDPFFTTKGPSGSGLGLSQVYGMARQSGGAVRMESEPGKGTTVTLLLPRATESAEAEEPEKLELGPGRSLTPDLVLVVDDDNAVRQVTVEMVRDLGCQVLQAAGGAEALQLIADQRQAPTLVLLDYAMPGMNGLQVARALRERGITAPMALVTVYAELAEADAQATQLDGLLRKPFTIRELQGLLLQLRTGERERAQPVPAGMLTR